MKALKKLSAILLTLIMVFSLAVNVFAAEGEGGTPAPATDPAQTFKIQIVADETSGSTTNHVYKVYQIFTGDLTIVGTGENAEKTLTDVRYGSAWGETLKGTAVPTDDLKAITVAEDYADRLINGVHTETENIDALITKDTPTVGTLTEPEWLLEGVPAGYYLIVDDTNQHLTVEGDAFSKYIVQVVNDVEMTPKSEKTSGDKKLYNDDAKEDIVNDAGVGTVVSYKLTAHIAENANSYDFYNFILADTLSDGLTFNNDIKVYQRTVNANGEEVLSLLKEDEDYALYTGQKSTEADYADGYTFEVALLHANERPNQDIVVTYSATLNSKAVAMAAETNTYKVIYSNNPEHKYNGEGEQDQDNPGKPSNINSPVFGKTPDKTTETFTTKLILTKHNDKGNALKGATFKLTSKNANQTVLNTNEYYQLADGTEKAGTKYYYLLKDNTYTETAPTDPEYVKFGKGDAKTTEGYILKDGNYIVPTDVKDYIDQDLYKLSYGNADQYVSTNKYVKMTATSDASVSAPVEVILTTDETGILTFDGLGTGDYTLTEVDAPDGYNYAEPIEFNISFDATNKTFTVTSKGKATITANGGILETTVVDKSGSVLPSTGGIGTTLFYVIGGILMAGAGVLLITKRRMNAVQ